MCSAHHLYGSLRSLPARERDQIVSPNLLVGHSFSRSVTHESVLNSKCYRPKVSEPSARTIPIIMRQFEKADEGHKARNAGLRRAAVTQGSFRGKPPPKKLAGGFLELPSARRLQTQLLGSMRTDCARHCRRTWLSSLAHRWQGSLAVRLFGWAQIKRASVRGGNRLNCSCDDGTYHYCGQNRNPDCQLCIHLYFHCRAPFGPWGDFVLLLGSPLASDFGNASRVPNRLIGSAACGHGNFKASAGKITFSARLEPDPLLARIQELKQKRLWLTFMLGSGAGGAAGRPSILSSNGRFGCRRWRSYERGTA